MGDGGASGVVRHRVWGIGSRPGAAQELLLRAVGAHPLLPAASLATAALSAPSAREVPPIRPKLRMREKATLHGEEGLERVRRWVKHARAA